MKLSMEIQSFEAGSTENGGRHWARMWGKVSSGKFAPAVVWGPAAQALKNAISQLLPEGADIGSSRVLIEMVGEWKSREYTDAKGNKRLARRFEAVEFDLPKGPHLENKRIKRDASEVLAKWKKLREEGRAAEAEEAAISFVADLAGEPFDLKEDLRAIEQDDDRIFGEIDNSDPESVAAARYERMDARSDAAPEATAAKDTAGEAMKGDTEEVETIETAEPLPEDGDVLDDVQDADAANEEEVEEAPEPEKPEATKPAVPTPPRPRFAVPPPPGRR